MTSKGYAAGGAAKKMKKGYAAGGMAKDNAGRALKRKTEDATGRAMKKPVKMQMGGTPQLRMEKGGMAKKRGK